MARTNLSKLSNTFENFLIRARKLSVYSQLKSKCCEEHRSLSEKLLSAYRERKDQVEKEVFKVSLVNPRAVFVNNELDLSTIEVYGFDYDYTIAVYTSNLNNLIYELSLEKLLKDYKYPSEMKSIEYDKKFAVRGLHFDTKECLLMKLDAFLQIQTGTVYRGKVPLSDEEVRSVYTGFYVPKNFVVPKDPISSQTRMIHLADLFSLPAMGLLSTAIEYFTKTNMDFDPASLVDDVTKVVRSVHLSGKMYSEIETDMLRYVHKNPGLHAFLKRLKENNKTVFLITNSPFSFIDKGLNYLIGSEWRELFDYVSILARKPRFFQNNGHQPFRSYLEESGTLSWKKVSKIEKGKIYAEGNLEEFVEKTGLKGKNVLYLGDHIYSDLADPMYRLGWNTGAIVPELEKEITTQNSHTFQTTMMWLQALTNLIQLFQDQSHSDPESSDIMKKWLSERDELRLRTKSMFNPNFGSIFRTFHNPSYFSSRLMRLADVYTSRLPNFLEYGMEHTFYPHRMPLPHDYFNT